MRLNLRKVVIVAALLTVLAVAGMIGGWSSVLRWSLTGMALLVAVMAWMATGGARRYRYNMGQAPVLGRYRRLIQETPLTVSEVPPAELFALPAAEYETMHHAALSLYRRSRHLRRGDARLAEEVRAHARWGLYHAGAKAVLYALHLRRQRLPEAQEDGAFLLGNLARQPRVRRQFAEQFALVAEEALAHQEHDQWLAIDLYLRAVEAIECREAMPVLATLLRAADTDEESRWQTLDVLAKLVDKPVVHDEHTLDAAVAWLDRHGFA